MRILYTENNMITPYCKAQYIVPLLIICITSFLLIFCVQYTHDIAYVIFGAIIIASLISLIAVASHEEKQGYKYYVCLEENAKIDLTKYNIEEQKGDLYIITDK